MTMRNKKSSRKKNNTTKYNDVFFRTIRTTAIMRISKARITVSITRRTITITTRTRIRTTRRTLT